MKRLTDLRPQAENANKHNPRGLGLLEKSIQTDGWIGAITVAADGETFDGSARLEVGAATGFDDAIVVETDGTKPVVVRRTDIASASDPRARRLSVAANQIASVDWQPDAALLAEWAEADGAIRALWDDGAWAGLMEGMQGAPDIGGAGDEFDATPADGPTRTQPGDLWEIGPHRLLVGDCTDPANVERLMGGDKAEMMFTDPPYGVDYTGGHFHSGDVNIKRERERLAGDDGTALYDEFLPIVLPVVDGPCYMWFADRKAKEVFDAIDANRCEVHALIIWHKVNATYAAMNAQYKQRHEPCLYFKPSGSTLRWCGPSDECTLWEIRRDSVNEFHPTQKPIELVERALKNHKASIVIDPFGGSGTTLIAAHQQRRRAFLVELSPAYADVILRRAELAGLVCSLAANLPCVRRDDD